MAKYRCIAYFLWQFGGWTGLHHVYLGRYYHAFTWWCTLGGCFGLGWFRDFFYLNDYIKDCNKEKVYMERLKSKITRNPQPPFYITRFLGKIVLGLLFGLLFRSIISDDLLDFNFIKLYDLLVPLIVASGVWIVANIGHQSGRFVSAVAGAYFGVIFYLFDYSNILYVSLFSTLSMEYYGKRWKKPTETSFSNRAIKFILLISACSIYSFLWMLALANNATITYNGETMKAKDSIKYFFTSPAWESTKNTLHIISEKWFESGYQEAYNEFLYSIDPQGELHSYKILEIPPSASEADIKAAYRNLVKQWHPDKHLDPKNKIEAEIKFRKIQYAYETLSSLHFEKKKKRKV